MTSGRGPRRPTLTVALAAAPGGRPPARPIPAQDPKPPPPRRPASPGPSAAGSPRAAPARSPRAPPSRSRPRPRQAIEAGLAWLAKQQNADGSFGTGTYRGNVAVTSLAGLAMMASGSSPGRGPYGPQIDKALQYVMDNTSASGFIACPTPRPTARCTATASARCSSPRSTA